MASALSAVQIAVALPLRKDGLAYHRSRKQQKALLYRSSLHYQVRKQRVCGEKQGNVFFLRNKAVVSFMRGDYASLDLFISCLLFLMVFMRSQSSGLVKLCIKTKFRGNGGCELRQDRAMGILTNRIRMFSQAEHDETQSRSIETRDDKCCAPNIEISRCLALSRLRKHTNQPINQPTKQPTNQQTKKPTNQLLLYLLQTIHFLVSQETLNIFKMFANTFIPKFKNFLRQSI